MGLLSIHKLVKPSKVVRSWCQGETRIDQLLVIETEPKVRATHTAVLREANPAVGRELGGLDLANRRSDEVAKFRGLFFRNQSTQILNLGLMLSREDDQGDIRNPRHPGVAKQLRVERQQPRWLIGITTRCGLPVHETTEAIGLGSGTVQRELQRLSKADILVRTTEGRQNYYQANHRSPVFDELRGLVRKTFGATQVLQQALGPIANRIKVAFIFGSVASGTERSESDLDLLVVANDVTLSDLIPAVQEAERELGREVNPSLYTPKEFSRRLAARQNFLSNVVEGPKLFLIGDEHELGRLAKVRLAEGAQDQPQRNRRTHGRGRSRPRGLEDSGSPQ